MNTGPPVGKLVRCLLRPTGWGMILLAAAATGAMLWLTGWPVVFGGISAAPEFEYLLYPPTWSRWREAPAAKGTVLPSPTELLFIACIAAWALLLLIAVLRWLLRVAIVVRHGHCFEEFKARRWRLLVLPVLFAAMFALVAFGWVQRTGREWAGRHLAAWEMIPAGDEEQLWGPRPVDEPYQISYDDRRRSLEYVIRHASSLGLRVSALNLLLSEIPYGRGEDNREFLVAQARIEYDARMLAGLLLLIGIQRDAATAAFLAEHLDHEAALVRAAAADALGVLHRPLPALPLDLSRFTWPADEDAPGSPGLPSVNVYSHWQLFAPVVERQIGFYERPVQIRLPAAYRERLVQIAAAGPTTLEREAAARALVGWPPDNYQLRVAEWGVWLVDGSDLKLVKSIIEEIPPFVHRTGNPERAFLDRVSYPSVVTKPIVHITASELMAIDIEVQISEGRPWFAYPRPDQFNVQTGSFRKPVAEEAEEHSRIDQNVPEDRPLFIAPLYRPDLPPLTPLHEGYPWVHPGHRHLSGGNAWGTDPPDIFSLGLRWQSLIISPRMLPWMTLPDAGADPEFQWWPRLRDVPAGY